MEGRVGRVDIDASQLGVMVYRLVWVFIMARVAGRASVVGTRRVIGPGGVVVFADKATKMASTNQFFDFILECFTFL